jgi:carbonic anhydrase/acetyltransferase-like protein (isoleucine patch superfamily)
MIYQLESRRVQLRGEGHYVAHNAAVIGSVILHARSSVWFNAVIRGDNESISIGAESNIQDGAVLHTDDGFPMDIGPEVTVGHMAMLHGCTIGRNCLIGLKSVVMNGAVIEPDCIIGANSLIAEGKTIPARSLVMGSPGRVVRELRDDEITGLREFVDIYLRKIDKYRRGFKPDIGVHTPDPA